VGTAGTADRPVVVERDRTERGELVLRRAGEHFEIISNGVFLMDTRGGESERLLVRLPLDHRRFPARVLIAGLGVGFSLAEAVRHPRTAAVDVVECEAAVIDWHRHHLAPYSAGAAGDPRVRIINTDLLTWLDSGDARPEAPASGEAVPGARVSTGAEADPGTAAAGPPPWPEGYDVACVDIDNGPDWTVTEANAALYTAPGLESLRRRLRPGGLLAVWSAHEAPDFEERLRAGFASVDVHRVPVRRGAPDVVYLAAAPGDPGAPAGVPDAPPLGR
jgi:spermidine synthase